MAKPRVSDAVVSEWKSELDLAERFYKQHVEPTEKYARAFRSNAALWDGVNWNEDYHRISANLVFANTQANLARSLARNPKIHVLPATRATRMSQRMQQQTGIERFVAAALVQQMANWRWREFDFSRQVLRAALDAETRGFGLLRHGFKAEDETSLTRKGDSLEIEHHKHIRGGWPFAVHWPVARVLWDQKAREPDERQWVSFLDFWRPEDLKQSFGLRGDVGVTHTLGIDLLADATAGKQTEFGGATESVFGRVGVWEVWDRRRKEVFHIKYGGEEILKVSDWPLEFEGLPDTMLWTQESSDRMWPVPDVSLTWELQQLLNVQLSMLAVYVKRGVPVVTLSENAMEKTELEKLEQAQILEFIKVRSNQDAESVKLLNLQPPIQNLLAGIQQTMELMRVVGGNSRLTLGARENVESATEAAALTAGGDIRNEHRVRAVEKFAAEIVRKDWQVFQQTVSGTQILDIVGHSAAPQLVKLGVDQIQQEYEFTIAVGSTEPASEAKERNRIVSFLASMQSDPELRAQMRPEFLARRLTEAFGYDSIEALAQQNAATQQVAVDALGQALFGGGTMGGNGSSIGAALDASKTEETMQ